MSALSILDISKIPPHFLKESRGLFVKFLFKIRHGTMNSLIESLWDLQISNNFARSVKVLALFKTLFCCFCSSVQNPLSFYCSKIIEALTSGYKWLFRVSEQPPCWIFSVNKAPNVSCTSLKSSNLSKTATIERLKKRKKPVKNCLLWRTLFIFYELAHWGEFCYSSDYIFKTHL